MGNRIISSLLIAFITVVCASDVVKGQTIDSLLYVIDNDLAENDVEKYELLCLVLENLNDAESKIRYGDQAIKLGRKLDILPALPYLFKGEGYLDSGKLALALECFIQAASYYKMKDDRANLGRAYMYMAETYNKQGNRENEKHYLQNAIEIFEQEKDSFRLAYALHNLGYYNYSREQFDTALIVYNRALDLLNRLNAPYAKHAYFVYLGNTGLVYSRLSEFDKAEEYLVTAMDTLDRLGDKNAVAEFLIEYASLLRQKGDIQRAIAAAYRALNLTDIPNYQRDASLLLAGLYEHADKYDSAYYYQSVYIVASDSVNNIEQVHKMADLRTEYEVGLIQAEVDVLEKNKLINRIIIIGLGIILILAVALVTTYYRNLKRSKKLTGALEERRVMLEKQSAELKERNDEILNANEELKQLNEITSHQRDEIISSINYAQRIQSAILPPETYFTELLNENFILYKPRDIVSGDFYWIKQVNMVIVLVAADCTGHGVPGALLSMLGMSYLDEIVQRREITQANEVLNELRNQIKHSLRQHGQVYESKDGMDMALCAFDMKKGVVQYSGANNPLYLIKEVNGTPELKEIKADPMPIGYFQGKDKSFTNHSIRLELGDTIYLFSDGFIDQKGGRNNKRFLSKNFKNLLLRIHEQPMHEQKRILDKTLTDWMGNNAQIDDILVIGVRL